MNFLENNWRQKSLENLEKDKWESDRSGFPLVNTIHTLRKVTLEKLTIENLRVLISQEVGLNYLIPLSIEKLEENLWAEGDNYEGDLLEVVLKVNEKFWLNNKSYWSKLDDLISDYKGDLEQKHIDITIFYEVL